MLLRPHPERWSMLAIIANNPGLAKHVKYLEIAEIDVLSWVHSLDHWNRCFYSPRVGDYEILAYPRHGIGSTYAMSFDGSNGSADTEDIVEKHYRKYRYWVDGGRDMEGLLRAGSVPLIDLRKLTNLRAMTTLDPRNIVSVPVREWSNRGSPVAQPGNIVFVDRYEIDSSVRYNLRDRRVAQPEHLEYAIGAIHQSTAALPSLILHHSCEVIRMWPNSPCLTHLRKLVIARPYQGVSENEKHDRSGRNVIHRGETIKRNDLATWVKQLPSLHTLDIAQRTDDHELLNLVHLLGVQRYPNLRVLSLQRVLTFATDLRRFVFAHIDDLESLTIDTPAVFLSEWKVPKEETIGKAPASCHLQLTESFRPRVSRRNRDRKIQMWWATFHERMIEDTVAE